MTPAPSNRLTGAERLERAKQDGAQGWQRQPRDLTGHKGARYEWIESLCVAAELRATERWVGVVLALAGNVDGTRIYPSVEGLARRCALSERVVCKSIRALVRSGRLLRQFREGARGMSRGFLYRLSIPSALTESQHSALTERQHRKAPVLTLRQRSQTALTQDQRSTDAGAMSADANDSSALTQRQPTIPRPVHIPVAGDLADARRPESREPAEGDEGATQ